MLARCGLFLKILLIGFDEMRVIKGILVNLGLIWPAGGVGVGAAMLTSGETTRGVVCIVASVAIFGISFYFKRKWKIPLLQNPYGRP